MNNISIETKRADIEEKSSLYDIVKQYLIDYPLKHSIFTDVPYHDTLPLNEVIVHIGGSELTYVAQTEDPDKLNISFRQAPFKWVLTVPHDSNKIYLVLDVDINDITGSEIKNFVDYLCVKLEVITQTEETNKVNVDNPTSENVGFVPRAEDMFAIATEYLKTLPNIYRNQHYLDGTDGRFEFKIAPTTARVNCIMHKDPAGIFLIMGENRLRFDFKLTRFNRVVANNRTGELDEDDEETNECISFVNLFLLKYLNSQYEETTSTDMRILRNHITHAIKELPSFRRIIERSSNPYQGHTITLIHNNKTVSLDIGIEDDVCVLRSSEMYANYQFKHSRFGNISMQRILNPQYPNEVIGACLTTDAVNEILCYLSDKYKKVSLFDYLRPVLDTWVGGPYLIDNKQQGDKRVYLQFIGDYKKVVIEELDIPEKLRFTSTNCFNEEGFIKIAENGEDIEIVLDRTKFQDKEVQGFIDHLIKELNATTSITRTSILNAKEDIKMENKNSALDNLFYNVVECIEKLSIAIKQNTNPIYILKGTSLAVQCTVKKRSDGVIVTSDDQKVFKFSLNMFNEISLSYDTSLPDQLDGVILDIEKQLKQRYPGVGLHVYLFYKLFNVYPVGEQSFMFKVRISAELSDLIITRIDDNACFLTFDIPESQYAFLLAKNVNNDGINIAYVPHSLEISLELKPTLDAFIQRLNLTWTSHNVALDKYEDEVEPSTEDTCDVIVEEDDDYYPVMIRTGKSDTRASKIHHLIGEGVRMVEEAYRLDNNSITVSDNVSVRDESSSNGVRNTRLNNARIYHISSDNLFTGDMIVILPVTNIPQVRAVLAHSIFVENGVIEKMVLNHDKLYNNIS